ncbi:hypothetical protein [Bacillus sp. Marseille-P3800]|uniref:hypothetical protein n=1 Tax=Bacillus sp. Marseille-P3800 TaxID=2014782 RepID=UPI000C08CA7F|nr:hypothetical protein [Bacillus sp. Marseille-P3800]
MELKNYGELCNLLKIKTKAGNSKKSQLAEIERFCKLRKVGHSFFIEEIYDQPLLKKDKRKDGKGNSVFSDIMQILILDTLVRERSKGNTLTKTRNQLLFSIGAVNESYGFHQERPLLLNEKTEVENSVIKDFYETSNSNFKGTLETALNALRKKSLLMYEKVNMVAQENVYREATSHEKEVILKAEIETLRELNIRDIHTTMITGNWEKFKMLQKENLKKIGAHFTFSYVAYKITSNEERYLQDEFDYLLDHLLSDEERIEHLNKLNELVASRFLDNAKRRHKKANELTAIGTPFKHKGNRQKKEYIDDFKKLIGLLISREDFQ